MTRRSPTLLGLALFAATTLSSAILAGEAGKIEFHRTRLDGKFRAEGVAAGDFNHDGKLDIGAGSVYFTAPDWKMHTLLDAPQEFDPLQYSVTFCNFAEDLNGDGWTDLLAVDFPGKETWWFENPRGKQGAWAKHVVTPVTNNESPDHLDVDGDGVRELVFGAADRIAYARRQSDPMAAWTIVPVSGPNAPGTNRFSHGIGLGDVNADGRLDVLINEGWWEAPAAGHEGDWPYHAHKFADACSHMYAYDFDGDGDNDVLCASAHGIGIWWHEHTADGFTRHEIDTSFSQTHSVCLADINGDGLMDFVTGKRWYAHGPSGDPQSDQPAVMYWFELARKDGRPVWTRHQFDHDSGVGTQFQVVDMNGDGLLDVITSNKKGTHYFEQARP